MNEATRNEAAERLRDTWVEIGGTRDNLLNEALAAERRATVERIRAAASATLVINGAALRHLSGILDEEAAR